MKRSELQEGYIYASGGDKYRLLEKIEFSEDDGFWWAHYRNVGCLLIRDRIHLIPGNHSCRFETFQKWALYGMAQETFEATRRVWDEAQIRRQENNR